MLFAAPKDDLSAALSRVSRVVKSNPKSVEILQCVKVESYGSNVYVVATSSMASSRVQVDSAVLKEPGSFVVSLDRLSDRVAKAGDSMALESDDTSLKIVSSDDQRLGLKTNDPREFTEIEWSLSEESYGIDKAELVGLFKLANSLAASSSSLTPAFLQAHLKEQKLWVANGISYHVFDVLCNPALESSIPTQTLSALIGFVQESAGDTVWLSQLSGDEVVVSVGDDQFQTTPLSVKFPDLEPQFTRAEVAAIHTISVNRTRLITELNKAKTSMDKHGRVTLTIEGQGTAMIKVETASELGDWYESKVPTIWSGPPNRALVFNLESLVKFLQSFKVEEIDLMIGDDFKSNLSAIYCSEGGHSGIINQFRI